MVRKLHLTADAALADVQRQLPFTLVNPENSDDVIKRFKRRKHEPEFVYAQKPDIALIRERLEAVKCGRTRPGRLLASEKEQLLAKCDMVSAIGTPAFAAACAKVYGKPDKALVERAEELVTANGAPKDQRINAVEVMRILKEAHDKLGFSYRITRTKMVSSAALSPATRTLSLRSKERFGKLYAYRLAVHEIATHALRAENGRQQKLGIFSRGTPRYLATEEGLAAYNEERAGVMSADILKRYAGRVIAVAYADKHTFVETYDHLRRWFGKDDAIKLALRAKRGLGSGTQPGSCTKDHLYLKGYFAVKDYVSAGGDLRQVFAGKIGLEDLDEWGKRLLPPKHIPAPVIEWVRHEMVKNNN